MASPLLLADACSDPVLLGGLILLIITCLFLIALRAVRLHAAHQLNKKTLVQPGPWSLVCMVLHLVSGLYMTEGYFRLCSNPGSTQSGIFKLLPSFLVLRLGTSANFYFMWLLRAKLTEYQQFRSYSQSLDGCLSYRLLSSLFKFRSHGVYFLVLCQLLQRNMRW